MESDGEFHGAGCNLGLFDRYLLQNDVFAGAIVASARQARDLVGHILAFDVQVQDGVEVPDPQSIVAQLRAPGLAALVATPTLTEPWQWNLCDVEQRVYAVEFNHPS